MKKNKFMTRVFSAMENQETEVLDQIQNDLEIAKEDGELDSEEYKITWDPDQEVFVLHDKVNNEHTEISEDEEAAFYMTDMTDANAGIPTPEESIPELSVNDVVKWTDELGHDHQGMITMISDGIATILENEVEVAAPIESLMKVEAPVEEVVDVDYTFSEKVEDYESSDTKYYARKIDEDKLIEAIFGAQGDVQASIMQCCADNNYKLSEALSVAKKIVKSRKDDEDWGNFEPSDRSLLMKKLDIRTFSNIDSPESFIEKEFGNPVNGDIPEGIDSKLQDLAQITGCINYSDIMKMQYTPEKGRKINYLYRVLQENGELTEKQCQHLKEIVNSVKSFSHIDSPESFREYAHKVMKEAHGDEYSEEVTNKVVDDLLADNEGADYGELIGRLTSGFGEKSFSQFGVAGFKYSSGKPEVITLFVDAKDKKEAREMFRSKYPTCSQIKAYNWQDNYDHELLADRYKDGFSAPPAPDDSFYSFVEKTFAKSDEVKKLEFEVARIKGLYDDVKARQKGETDPVIKSRNKRILQEIKVKLEQAKLAVYNKEFEESRSKNFSFVEKTFSKGKICLVYDEESDNFIAKSEESAKELAEKALGNFIVKTFESRDQLNDYISRGDYRRVGRNRWVGGEEKV